MQTDVLATDVLIAGGGAAGLALAAELDALGVDVILAERGPDAERPPPPEQTGAHHFNLDGRRYRLGGGLNDWGANCALLDPCDFEPLADFPDWPIARSELDSRVARAAMWLGMSAADLRATGEAGVVDPAFGAGPEGLVAKAYARTDPLTFPGLLRRKVQGGSARVRVLTGCRCESLELGSDKRQVRAAMLVTRDRRYLRIEARRFVVAAGADTAALLMQALGDDPDQNCIRWPALGRYLHAHLMPLNGLVGLSGPPSKARQDLILRHALQLDLGLTPWMHLRRRLGLATDPGRAGFRRAWFSGLQARQDQRRAQGLCNGVTWLAPIWRHHPLIGPDTRAKAGALGRVRPWHNLLLHSLTGPAALPPVLALRHFVEQPARSDARLALRRAPEVRTGVRVQVHWGIGETERRTIARQTTQVLAALERAGFGPALNPQPVFDSPDMLRNAHPMGGAIMGHDPRHSVVDRDLRVHGLGNLYLCGGAVVPRGGVAMVTGVILLLALRLADHLRDAQ